MLIQPTNAAEREFAKILRDCEEISVRCCLAPLSDRDKAGLTAMVAAHFIGTAGGAMQALTPEISRPEILDALTKIIVGMAIDKH